MIMRLADVWRKFHQLYRRDIWQPAHLKDQSPRGLFYAALRVISITWTVFNETKAASRAASLSFSSLLGLGPLVAIAVLVAGFMLDKNDPYLAANTLNRLITFVAPQLTELSKIEDQSKATELRQQNEANADRTPAPGGTATPRRPQSSPPAVEIDPGLLGLINGFIAQTRSSTAGAIGALTLILIVMQLFTSIENAFNEIWGVHRGRNWLTRLVFYWTILTLGSVLFFAAVTGLSAGALFNAFEEKMPFGVELVTMLRFFLPSISGGALIVILAMFYRYIPNTRVLWRAAFIGAIIVALLLFLNNFLAFLYLRRVILNKSLWGSLGIFPVLMVGLYIFWLYVLIGGQISYAIQKCPLPQQPGRVGASVGKQTRAAFPHFASEHLPPLPGLPAAGLRGWLEHADESAHPNRQRIAQSPRRDEAHHPRPPSERQRQFRRPPLSARPSLEQNQPAGIQTTRRQSRGRSGGQHRTPRPDCAALHGGPRSAGKAVFLPEKPRRTFGGIPFRRIAATLRQTGGGVSAPRFSTGSEPRASRQARRPARQAPTTSSASDRRSPGRRRRPFP